MHEYVLMDETEANSTPSANVAITSARRKYLPPFRAILLASAAALNNVSFGYDVGVISGSLSDMASSLSLSTWEQEMATSGLNYVSGFGALLVSGNVMDRYGRRLTLLCASLLLLLGSVVVTCANSFPVLLLGRALQGLGSGSGWCAATVYITEVAPREWRGALVAIADIAINVGILLGYVIDRAVNVSLESHGADTRWRVAMALSALLPLAYCCGCHPCLPESPRWLLMVGRDPTEALRRTSPGATDEWIRDELAAMRAAPKVDDVSWRSALCPASAKWRWKVLTAMALGLGQQLTGTEAILYYTPRILNQCPIRGGGGEAGGEATVAAAAAGRVLTDSAVGSATAAGCTSADAMFVISLGVGFSKLLGELVSAAVLVENTGRRITMTLSNLLVSLGVFIIALKFKLNWPVSVGAVALSFVMLVFSLGPGPLTFVVVNEMLPLSLRGKVVALSVLCNRFGSGTIALTFLSLKQAVGVFEAFALYALLGLVVTAFYHLGVPDATGKSLEETEEEEAGGVGASADGSHGGGGLPGPGAVTHSTGSHPAPRAATMGAHGWSTLVEDGDAPTTSANDSPARRGEDAVRVEFAPPLHENGKCE